MSDEFIPDPAKLVARIHSGVAVVRHVWPFLGLVWLGCCLMVIGSLPLAPDLVHHVLGLPPSIKVCDYRTVWIIGALSGLVFSVWALGGRISSEARRLAFADARFGRLHLVDELDKWKQEDETLECPTVIELDMAPSHPSIAVSITMAPAVSGQPVTISNLAVGWVFAGKPPMWIPVFAGERLLDDIQTFTVNVALQCACPFSGAKLVGFSFTRHHTHWKDWSGQCNA